MQMQTGVNLRWVVPRFPERVWPEEQAELVNDFVVIMDAIVATMDVEGILCGVSKRPDVFSGSLPILSTSQFLLAHVP